jgi:hypothetical protein
MVSLEADFTGEVAVVLEFVGTTPDYTISSGVLTINRPLSYLNRIEATIFENASSMGASDRHLSDRLRGMLFRSRAI